MNYESWQMKIIRMVIDGFQDINRKDRTRHGRGVAIYIKKTSILRNDLTKLGLDIESISIELSVKYVKPIIISTLCRPPDSLVELFDPIEKLVSNIDQKNKQCIITGDFNCDLLKTGDNNLKHMRLVFFLVLKRQ